MPRAKSPKPPTVLNLSRLREAVLHFLEMAALFEQKQKTPGFVGYSYPNADIVLETSAALLGIVDRILKHKGMRDTYAERLRVACLRPHLYAWMTGDADDDKLEPTVLEPLRSLGKDLAAKNIKTKKSDPYTREEYEIEQSWLEVVKEAKGGESSLNWQDSKIAQESRRLSPAELTGRLLGILVGVERQTIVDLEKALAGAKTQGPVQTQAEAEELHSQDSFPPHELIMAVLVALPPAMAEHPEYFLAKALAELSRPRAASTPDAQSQVDDDEAWLKSKTDLAYVILKGFERARVGATAAAFARAYVRLADEEHPVLRAPRAKNTMKSPAEDLSRGEKLAPNADPSNTSVPRTSPPALEETAETSVATSSLSLETPSLSELEGSKGSKGEPSP